MSVRHAGLRILSTSNLFFPCPHKIVGARLTPSPSFTATRGKWILNVSDTTTFVLACCFGWRIVWLYYHWDDYTLAHLSEAVVDFAALSAGIIGLCVTPIFRWSPDDFRWLLNQIFFQTDQFYQAAPLQALLLQIVAAGFILFPLSGFTAPFVLEVLPLQMFFGSSVETKLIASALYGLTCLSIAAKFLTFFTCHVLCIHIIHELNECLLNISETPNGGRQTQFDDCHRMYCMGILSLTALEDIIP